MSRRDRTDDERPPSSTAWETPFPSFKDAHHACPGDTAGTWTGPDDSEGRGAMLAVAVLHDDSREVHFRPPLLRLNTVCLNLTMLNAVCLNLTILYRCNTVLGVSLS
ncbi:hypothetical protein JCM24511_06663 [Saitozyma sp. JCM 24511]|nr:hypothetical protein JCM24511_06663 [Saitozyma sp. JCM 24511]